MKKNTPDSTQLFSKQCVLTQVQKIQKSILKFFSLLNKFRSDPFKYFTISIYFKVNYESALALSRVCFPNLSRLHLFIYLFIRVYSSLRTLLTEITKGEKLLFRKATAKQLQELTQARKVTSTYHRSLQAHRRVRHSINKLV